MLASLDLARLWRTDPQAASIGAALSRAPGANRDGDPLRLTRDEFLAVAPLEYQVNPPLRPVLERLERAFWAETGPQVEWNAAPLLRASSLKPLAQHGLPMPGVMFGGTAFIGRGDTGEVLRSDAPFTTTARTPVIAAEVAGVTVGGRRWLYTEEPGATGLTRREVLANGLGRPQRVTISPPPGGMHWPQMTALPDGRVALAAVIPNAGPYLAISSDGGRSFQLTAWLGQTNADTLSLAHLGTFGDGTLVATTQAGNAAGQVQSYVRTSTDGGRTFTAPLPVTTSSPNVHDAFVTRRADGDVDLYYLRQSGEGFAAFRRSFSRDGQLGPEQQLTGADVGSVEKPQAFRQPDGQLRLVMARRNRLDDFDVVTTLLPGDAPKA